MFVPASPTGGGLGLTNMEDPPGVDISLDLLEAHIRECEILLGKEVPESRFKDASLHSGPTDVVENDF